MSTFSADLSFPELRRIGHLRRHLTVDATKKLVSSFVVSRLVYCDSLLSGLPENRLIACTEYKAMHLVLSLADEGETRKVVALIPPLV